MTTTISDFMKRRPSELEQRRDLLVAELASRQEVNRQLRQELSERAEYIRGMMEGNSDFAPSTELLEALIR
jgi:hypothetical protein